MTKFKKGDWVKLGRGGSGWSDEAGEIGMLAEFGNNITKDKEYIIAENYYNPTCGYISILIINDVNVETLYDCDLFELVYGIENLNEIAIIL